jgi:hypothetical protein
MRQRYRESTQVATAMSCSKDFRERLTPGDPLQTILLSSLGGVADGEI